MTNSNYLESVIRQFEYYKMLGEKAMEQLPDDKLTWQPNEESNSIATVVKHLWGNMLSRWTDFLHSDGEKPWRDRDAEFENNLVSRDDIMQKWNEGWNVCLTALRTLRADDLEKIIYIRNEGHTVMEAINRQLAHYPYHVGQIVFIAKMAAPEWKSLSIPKGGSKTFNQGKFQHPPERRHFTDDFIEKKNNS